MKRKLWTFFDQSGYSSVPVSVARYRSPVAYMYITSNDL